MKRTIFLVIIGLLGIGCTSKTKDPQTAKNETTIKKADTTQVSTISNESEFNEHDVNPGPVDTSSYIFDVVDKMPQFPGGDQKLFEFISKQLKYPVSAQNFDIQGKVICRIMISKTGKVKKPEILRSLDRACDKEALRVLKALPRFTPGKLKGKVVNVWYTIPVTFKLE